MMTEPQTLNMPDADVRFWPGFFDAATSDAYLRALTDNIVWKQEAISLYGKSINLPRLTAWYGDEGRVYSYSGITVHPLAWTADLLAIKSRVELAAGVMFNSVLLNMYRSGADSVSWHSDDEPELGTNPVIASVSFGGERVFQFKHKHDADLRAAVTLTHGSLLLMAGATQHYWKHQIPKTKKPVEPRINLTFRIII